MQIHNLKRFKPKHGYFMKAGYLENGNLACAVCLTDNNNFQNYVIRNMITDEVVATFKNASIGYYNLHNIVNNPDKFDKKIYGELDDKQQKQYEYVVCGEFHVLSIKRISMDHNDSLFHMARDTNYGFAALMNYSSNNNNGKPQIVFLTRDGLLAEKSKYKFSMYKRIQSFIPSLTEKEKFLFTYDHKLTNHNNKVIKLQREPIKVAYSPDNKNVALAIGDRRKSITDEFNILDAETLQIRYTMTVPAKFKDMAFSQDGLKLALVGTDSVVEVDLE